MGAQDAVKDTNMARTRLNLVRTGVSVLLLLAIGATVIGWSALRRGSAETRIVLVARDMRFYLEDDGAAASPNPELRFRAGEPVTLVLKNQDSGMRHDLVIDGTKARTNLLDYGEEAEITFTPSQIPRTTEYFCTIHPRTMRGRVAITAP